MPAYRVVGWPPVLLVVLIRMSIARTPAEPADVGGLLYGNLGCYSFSLSFSGNGWMLSWLVGWCTEFFPNAAVKPDQFCGQRKSKLHDFAPELKATND